MSEQIKITVVMGDEKQNTAGKEETLKRILVTQDPFMTLMSTLRENRLMKSSFCGGRGECGRCAVQFLDGAPMPSAMDRKRFLPEELRWGYRLACMAKPRTDCVVRLLQKKEPEVPILTKTIPLSDNIDLNSLQNKQTENQIASDTEFSNERIDGAEKEIKNADAISKDQSDVMIYNEDAIKKADDMDYMIAVDLGTTTIAMQLYSLKTGEAVDTYCERNPQRSYGADVLSRIQASCAGHREDLQKLVCEALQRGLRRFLSFLAVRCGDVGKLRGICIAGNTTMEHLLMGYSVQSLGRSPFTPVEIGVQETTASGLFACLDRDASELKELPVYLTPGISAFVGGDVAAGLYALRMLPGFESDEGSWRQNDGTVHKPDGKAERKQDDQADDGAAADRRVYLLIDLGTNGEMAITDGKRMLVTATAAGPAFEGGAESDLIGTDRIALTASLLRLGVLDETGLLSEPYFSEGVFVESESGGGSVKLRQAPAFMELGQEQSPHMKKEDIRALQMAKAAIRAGVEILWQEMGCPRVDRVYLAGGFGYELDVEAAFAIGLLPVRLRGRVQAVGNTSLAGAFLMGRALLEGRIDRLALAETLSSGNVVESVNLAKRKNFAELYLQYMNLEEN